MLPGFERASPTMEAPTATSESSINPPAFLDLADSAARLNSNLPDINARIEQKRLEHERQRLLQRQQFEQQMLVLEHQQRQEEEALLAHPHIEGGQLDQHVALSAPTTPPRSNVHLNGNVDAPPLSAGAGGISGMSFLHHQAITNGLNDYAKRHSANYGSLVTSGLPSQSSTAADGSKLQPGSHGYAGAKSMPGSRRGSSGSSDAANDLTSSLNLASLSIHDPQVHVHRGNVISPLRSTTNPEALKSHAAHLFDEDLDNEMSNSLRHLPTQTEDDRINVRANYTRKLSVSGSALDLAPLQQTRPFPRGTELDNGPKTSEWPQFSGLPRTATDLGLGAPRLSLDRSRSLTRNVTIGAIGSDISSPDLARRPSPPSVSNFSDVPSLGAPTPGTTGTTASSSARSVPATPMSTLSASAVLRSELGVGHPSSGMKVDTNQHAFENGYSGGRSPYDSLTFGSIRTDEQQNEINDTLYHSGSSPLEFQPRNGAGYGYPSQTRSSSDFYGSTPRGGVYPSSNSGSFGVGAGRLNGHGNFDKANGLGLGGAKHHKRGDVDREWNRFAGSRLEDLQGEIPAMCKDQHGCRYLQKKLEEGVTEQRDLIFRETYPHLSDLMTDPFGNYLCQKLLEYSSDEQRNLICESVAQDLVSISLNMHGTRAVQKMIDFLSTQRQTDARYDAQVHTIIVALSHHVVTLIKDLNGNHVVQKCLNKLAPEDNQFIYNAVASHCVEVATHRHGCCVLQRCVDHASDSQRIQLVTEITYHALTLVQDPYGNYVVQYILDLNDNRFSDAVVRQFFGNVCALSVQKFSSNVIEKCIRVADHNTRKMIIEEFLNRSRLEKLLRDSFGNYCVQTALDYAEPSQRMVLVDGIRPILPLIRNTPYGKRIQSKLQRDQNGSNEFGFNRNQYGGPMRRASQQLGDPYGHGAPLYAMSPPNPSHLVQAPLIPSQVRHISPRGLDPYGVSPIPSQALPQSRTPVPNLGVASPYSGMPSYGNGMGAPNGYMTMPQTMSYPYA